MQIQEVAVRQKFSNEWVMSHEALLGSALSQGVMVKLYMPAFVHCPVFEYCDKVVCS